MRKIAALIAAAAALGLAPRHASAQQLVTCESRNNDREICGVNTAGGVTLRQQLSGTRCIQGRSWGYTRNAIWVSNGCRAQFVVNNGRQYGRNGSASNGRNGNVYNNGRRNTNYAANAEALCRQQVQNSLNRRVRVDTWMMNSSQNNVRVGWRVGNGPPGECRIDRNGRVTLR